MAEIINTFTNGMVLDAESSVFPKGAYKYARNAIHKGRNTGPFGLHREESTALAVDFEGGRIKGWSYIDERHQTLLFVLKDGESQLWIMDHNTGEVEFVVSDAEMDCNWGFSDCEFLYGEFKSFNSCNELHVYWSSACVYHVLNIDEMLDPDRKEAVRCHEDCSYFEIFKTSCAPKMSAMPVGSSTSTLEAGLIQFAVQFADSDGNVSNPFSVSEVVRIQSDDNIPGQTANQSARLTLTGLDEKWEEVIIYVIQTVGGVRVVRKMPARGYSSSGLTFDYYGQAGTVVDISSVLTKGKAYLRGQDLMQVNGRLWLYNIKNERNLNYQKYANRISVEWVEYEVSMEQQLKYNFPSLMRGETYALALRWNYVDGTHSKAFHIPGPGAELGEENCDLEFPDSNDIPDSPLRSSSYVEGFEGEGTVGAGPDRPVDDSDVDAGDSGISRDGVDEISTPQPDNYDPIDPGSFNSDEEFERRRNPSAYDDRRDESDLLEESTQDDIQNIDTQEDAIKSAAECEQCWKENNPTDLSGLCDTICSCQDCECEGCAPPPECDCSSLPDAMNNDLDDISNTHQNNAELSAGYGIDDPDPGLNETTSLRDAADRMVEDAVKKREYIKRKRNRLNHTSTSNSVSQSVNRAEVKGEDGEETSRFTRRRDGVSTEKRRKTQGTSPRGDNWVDIDGNYLTDEPIRKIAKGPTTAYKSTIPYPDDVDCDGNRFYPLGTVRHHRIPWTSERPHFSSSQNGVVNRHQPENYEYGGTYTRPMGIRLSNIKFPSPDELPKPLCPNSPFTILYVKRTQENKSVLAKGWLSGTFKGEVYGKEYAYPRHGVNSFETVDRFISSGSDGLSRMGTPSDDPIYTFHSPDTDCDRSFIPATDVKPELALKGSGWRYGLYAEGKRPEGDQWNGTRVDNRGARVANNINHYDTVNAQAIELKGLSYAEGNTTMSTPNGMSLPLMNRYRERSVYLETESRIPGDEVDQSFVGDVLTHEAPTLANAPYVALIRDLPDQYGSVQSLQYIPLGVAATRVHAKGGSAIEGLCGDVWISPYSKRRTSYVSNKQGDTFNVPNKPGSPCRPRTWCDSPEDKIFQHFGIDYYPTRLPKSGDKWDAKNYAGLHTVAGPCGALGKSKTPAEAYTAGRSETDFYWPLTLKSLVHCVVESEINPALRETGQGDQLQEGKVWYPKLKGLYLDSAAPSKHPWEESFMNRFYGKVEQPSRKQLYMKAMVRTVINAIVPAGYLLEFSDIQTILDGVTTVAVFPMLSALWIMAMNTLFRDDRLNELLGIGDCKTDEEGGDLDDDIVQWEDAYSRYNLDYSAVNDVEITSAFPLPYNTCDCDDCNPSSTNNRVYYSNPQNLESELDAYRNVLMNNYLNIPAHAGRLRKLFEQGDGLYAHTTSGIWLLRMASEQFSTQIAYQQAGTGQLLSQPQQLFASGNTGFGGTNHPNASINTPMGYYFIDDIARKIYRFDGRIEEISSYGVSDFMKDHLPFCEGRDCVDEKSETGVYYTLGWDPRYDRLLLTKRDGSDCSSFTMSYTSKGVSVSGQVKGQWISFHDYIPEGYLWDRNNFYSILGGKVWRHHVPNKYGTLHGEKAEFMVEFPVSDPEFETFMFEYMRIDTEASKVGDHFMPIEDLDITFSHGAFWNSTQGTGTLPFELVSDDKGSVLSQRSMALSDFANPKLTKEHRAWFLNTLADLVDANCEKSSMLIKGCRCQPIPDVNEDLFNCETINRQDYANRLLQDKYLMVRLSFSGADDIRLFLRSVRTYDDEKPRMKQG